ncbi:PEP-CTERM sorting domain-containing protein [Adhaeretor mobilis]|uniref:PEP-CTERM protein-sorting domain-containing protein n=1 Tax=Adhaeretor mobilis TaxID=1930276 RepID=A0A517MVH0_9BACT|nr:PEP-CTERM sorting domain-containing protein [Adhaeretor mobilis]QDS98875.1 hypothetical protein HG15A2_21610 [Adhaeretor mobilis]
MKILQVARVLSIVVAFAITTAASALPPLGLTLVGPAGPDYQQIDILGDSAYLGRPTGITVVDTFGNVSAVDPTHSTLGTPFFLRRPILADDGDVYYAANFRAFSDAAALYRIDQPATPVTTWLGGAVIGGVLPSLVSLGYNGSHTVRYFPDGSSEPFPVYLDALGENPGIGEVTPNGIMAGGADIIGSIGTESYLWDASGDLIGFPFDNPLSLRDRDDGNGFATDLNNTPVVYTNNGTWSRFITSIDFNEPAVFQTSWVVTGTDLVFGNSFFNRHGVSWSPLLEATPENPLVLQPLLEVFPDLPPMVNSRLIDADTIDGRFYLLFETDGQTYLYGGMDPSVVPEPTTLALGLLSLAMAVFQSRRRA